MFSDIECCCAADSQVISNNALRKVEFLAFIFLYQPHRYVLPKLMNSYLHKFLLTFPMCLESYFEGNIDQKYFLLLHWHSCVQCSGAAAARGNHGTISQEIIFINHSNRSANAVDGGNVKVSSNS